MNRSFESNATAVDRGEAVSAKDKSLGLNARSLGLDDTDAQEVVVGNCQGFFAVISASELKEFHRGYALIGLPVTVIALLVGIAYLVAEVLF